MDGFNGIADFIWEEEPMMTQDKSREACRYLAQREDGGQICIINAFDLVKTLMMSPLVQSFDKCCNIGDISRMKKIF